jgi:hypothetical protein
MILNSINKKSAIIEILQDKAYQAFNSNWKDLKGRKYYYVNMLKFAHNLPAAAFADVQIDKVRETLNASEINLDAKTIDDISHITLDSRKAIKVNYGKWVEIGIPVEFILDTAVDEAMTTMNYINSRNVELTMQGIKSFQGIN